MGIEPKRLYPRKLSKSLFQFRDTLKIQNASALMPAKGIAAPLCDPPNSQLSLPPSVKKPSYSGVNRSPHRVFK